MSGRVPECDNLEQLRKALYNKEYLIKADDSRFKKGALGLPFSSYGLAASDNQVDLDYFNITPIFCNDLDPAVPKHLEVCDEAIADAGYDPAEIKGLRVGVYSAVVYGDQSEINSASVLGKDDKIPESNYFAGIRSFLPNMVSHYYDITGPSFTVDSACSSSGLAMDLAYKALKAGQFDMAIVSGNQRNLSPFVYSCHARVGIASTDSMNMYPFDARACGMCRTEGIIVVILQKARCARRVYGKIIESNFTANGFCKEGITFPSKKGQVNCFRELLNDAGISSNDIDYVEGHGTGTKTGDPVEMNAIAETFLAEGRKRPIYIGTIKSNIGHTEAAAACAGVVKACFALTSGKVPPNARFETPNPACPAALEGSLKVLTEEMKLTTPYIMINSFGVSGTTVALLLKSYKKPKSMSKEQVYEYPRLVLAGSRTQEGLDSLLDSVPQDLPAGYLALLDKLSTKTRMLHRGYRLFKGKQEIKRYTQEYGSDGRPVCFVFSGMGAQWPGMGQKMMALKPFAISIQRSAKTLKDSVGLDLFELLEADSKHLATTRRIMPAFVTITAIQMALVDLLTQLKIQPDVIVGHSHGELSAAYADGCVTAEEAIMAAYSRGHAIDSNNKKLIHGAMAAVALPYEEVCRICPKDLYVACDNGKNSVTVSGTTEAIVTFVDQLKKQKVLAKAVDVYGYSFHCPNIFPAAEDMRKLLKKYINGTRPRTKRFLSTSYPVDEWDSPECQNVGAEYFVHNLTNLVRFKDATDKIPKNAILLEIAPHSLLQPILRSSTGSDAAVIGLMKRNDPDNISIFLQSIGQFYCEGGRLQIERLYPPVKFPVPEETPMISQHIQYKRSFEVTAQLFTEISRDYEYSYDVNTQDSYLFDHFIDGRALFPAAGLIELVLKAATSKYKKNATDVIGVIRNFKIHKATVLTKTPVAVRKKLSFTVAISKGSDEFDDFSIVEGNSNVATGSVCLKSSTKLSEWEPPRSTQENDLAVPGEDIYAEIRINGYEYGPEFRLLHQVNLDLTCGMVKFNGKLIPFVDAMLLFYALANNDVGGFRLPTGALTIAIDYLQLESYLEKLGNKTGIVPVSFDRSTYTLSAPGVTIVRLQTEPAVFRGKQIQPHLEQYSFVPYTSIFKANGELERLLTIHMAICNTLVDEIKVDTSKFEKLSNDFKFNISKTASHDDIEQYLSDQDLAHKDLLNVLFEVSKTNQNDFQDRRNEFIEKFRNNYGKDLINCILSSDVPLKIMLDIITENSRRRLSVLEVNISGHPIILDVLRIVSSFSQLKIKSKTLVNKSGHTHWNVENFEQNNITLLDSTGPRNEDLVIGSFLFGSKHEFQEILKEMTSAMAKEGFLLLFTKQKMTALESLFADILKINLDIPCQSFVQKSLSECGLITVASKTDCFGNSVRLLRRPVDLPATIPPIVRISGANFQWVDELKSVLYGSNATSSDTVWLLADDTVYNGIIGMVNCLRQEPEGEKIRCVFAPNQDGKLTAFNLKHPFYQHLLQSDLVINIWNNGSWGSFRHVIIPHKTTVPRLHTHSYVDCTKLGDLSSFKWLESPIPYRPLGENKEIVTVQYSALNFKDVMLASGKLNPGTAIVSKECYSLLGLEFSGYDSQGRRVMGMTEGGALATTVVVSSEQLIPVPDSWTMEQAATVPVVYATALYALLVRGNLQPGEKILIHSATGGVGLAACSIAASMNCEIFATVGNEQKQQYLRKKFPLIKEDNISSSRNTYFEQLILKRTNGKGVDVVLNSLADDKFQASVRCLGYNGRFLEIGKYDMMLDRNLGLKPFLKNITFHGVFLDVLQTIGKEMKKLFHLLQDGIRKGIVKPLDSTVFSRDETSQAFKYMSSGFHVGKVLIKINDDVPEKEKLKSFSLPSLPFTYFYAHKVYIIIGGLGGFGVELAKWMLSKGAKHIVLTSRYGVRTPYHKLCLKRWKSDVIVSTRDVSKKADAEMLLQECMEIGPIGGIYNCAVVLKDAFLESTTKNDFMTVCAPKAAATLYLDDMSRRLCPQLDHFVCFSSISGGKGNAGQTNYGFANSVMERVCEQRVRDGFHGLAIQWGVIGDVGVVHRHMGDDAKIAGVTAQPINSCLNTLDFFLQSPYPVVSTCVLTAGTQSVNKLNAMDELAKIIGLSSASDLNPQKIIGELGIDSIRFTEITRLLENVGLDIPTQELISMSFDELKNMLNEKEESNSKEADKPVLMSTLVRLPATLRHSDCCILLHANETSNKTPLFITHLGDTDLEEIKALSKVFDFETYALVWTKGAPTSDLSNLADWYIKVIENTLRNSNKAFHIAGYKMGASLAVQIAIRSGGKCKSVMLFNASEDPYSIVSDVEVSLSEEDSLYHFAEQFVPSGLTNLKDELRKGKSTDEKISLLMTVLGVTGDDVLSATEAAADFGHRLRIARSPIVGHLDCNLLMLEDPDVVLANDIKEIVSFMSKICKGKVNIQRIVSREDYHNPVAIQRIKHAINGLF